eukprot:364991-Chlamydomonas_euryale.AAC.10
MGIGHAARGLRSRCSCSCCWCCSHAASAASAVELRRHRSADLARRCRHLGKVRDARGFDAPASFSCRPYSCPAPAQALLPRLAIGFYADFDGMACKR